VGRDLPQHAYIQFVLTGDDVAVAGDVAWVTLDENILQATGAPRPSRPELSGRARRGGQRVRPRG
jgi:hypothetical protein